MMCPDASEELIHKAACTRDLNTAMDMIVDGIEEPSPESFECSQSASTDLQSTTDVLAKVRAACSGNPHFDYSDEQLQALLTAFDGDAVALCGKALDVAWESQRLIKDILLRYGCDTRSCDKSYNMVPAIWSPELQLSEGWSPPGLTLVKDASQPSAIGDASVQFATAKRTVTVRGKLQDLKDRQIVEIHYHEDKGWKQAIWYGNNGEGELRSIPQAYKAGKTRYVQDIIPIEEVKDIRRPMLLVRAFHLNGGCTPKEFEALKSSSSYGRNFVSASVVEAQKFTTFHNNSVLVMDLGPCTQIYGGSSCNVGSGMWQQKEQMDMDSNAVIGKYLQQLGLECVEKTIAEIYNLEGAKVFDDTLGMCRAIADKTKPNQHNELLIQLHQNMVWGLFMSANLATLVRQFEETLGRRPFVVRQIGDDFIVNDDPKLTEMVKIE